MLRLFLAGVLGLSGCGDDDAPADAGGGDAGPVDAGPMGIDDSRPECENINPLGCLAPWPSSRYLVDDGSTATGRRIEIPEAAMPANADGVVVDPSQFNSYDGFSPMSSLVTVYPGLVDAAASMLPDEDHIADSLLPTSPTILLDAETGERVAHFAETDRYRRMRDPDDEAFYIRPAKRLIPNRRYIAATRQLVNMEGQPIRPSAYFQALRDGTPSESAELEARRDAFEDIFTELEAAGVERATLIEAWDFWTGTDEPFYRSLLHMRDDALMRAGARGLGCTVTSVEEPTDDPDVFRRIEGTFTVPNYLRSALTPPAADPATPPSRLIRDGSGLPMADGTVQAPFLAIIPRSVAANVRAGMPGTARLLTYGHGLFGGADEAGGGYVRGMINRNEMVVIATNWWGMAEDDRAYAVEMVGNMGRFPELTERMHQAMINFLVLTRSFAGVCSELAELQVDGMPAYDTNERYYLGISQGSIAGTVLAGISTDITRFALNVGAISYPIMTKRSTSAAPFFLVLDAWYRDRFDADLLWTMAELTWDTAEPATYAPHVIADPLPGTPPKRLLYAVGRYDALVPNAASDIAARTIGLPLLGPAPYTPYGLETTMAPADSAYVLYDMMVPPTPRGTAAPSDNATHEGVRRTEGFIQQLDAFFRPDGQVQHFCDGPCDPD